MYPIMNERQKRKNIKKRWGNIKYEITDGYPPPMLHGNESGYVEAKAYGSAEAKFFEKLGSGYVLEAYMYVYICVYIYYVYIYIKI